MALLSRQPFEAILVAILLSSGIWVASGKDGDGIVNFVFGDSLLDPGNNNYIPTLSRGNYPPNGIDFGEPTGRFTNGRTIGQELGAKDFIPPYLAPNTTGHVILRGVNYASGAGGILHHSGKLFGGRISMDIQIDYFGKTRDDIIQMIGVVEAQKLIKRAIFTVSIGANDFVNNYLIPVVSTPERKLVPPQVFVEILIDTFKLQLTRLYGLGARKIVVVNVGPIGCIPFQKDVNHVTGDECVSFTNELARSYNEKLRTLVNHLNEVLLGAQLVYADVYRIFSDIIDKHNSYGTCSNKCFENANGACCYAAGSHGGLIPCGPLSTVCTDRSKYVFWDPFHPTDAANVIITKRLLDGDLNDISPMNLRRLIVI
ncbi:GDSL esterase/lipase At4g16230 [Linum perenne]